MNLIGKKVNYIKDKLHTGTGIILDKYNDYVYEDATTYVNRDMYLIQSEDGDYLTRIRCSYVTFVHALHIGVNHYDFFDVKVGDYLECCGSKSKFVTKGKKYLVTDVYQYHNTVRYNDNGFVKDHNGPKLKSNYVFSKCQIVDDFGSKRRMASSKGKLWKTCIRTRLDT